MLVTIIFSINFYNNQKCLLKIKNNETSINRKSNSAVFKIEIIDRSNVCLGIEQENYLEIGHLVREGGEITTKYKYFLVNDHLFSDQSFNGAEQVVVMTNCQSSDSPNTLQSCDCNPGMVTGSRL